MENAVQNCSRHTDCFQEYCACTRTTPQGITMGTCGKRQEYEACNVDEDCDNHLHCLYQNNLRSTTFCEGICATRLNLASNLQPIEDHKKHSVYEFPPCDYDEDCQNNEPCVCSPKMYGVEAVPPERRGYCGYALNGGLCTFRLWPL